MTKGNCREAILDAALRLSAGRGLDAVSTAEICRASGATNGSVFHFFPTKDTLHAALYLRALESYQSALAQELESPRPARAGVRRLVLGHVAWLELNPNEARFLHEGRRHAATRAIDEEIQAKNRAFFARFAGWLGRHIEAGEIRALPVDAILAVVFGPVHMMTRDVIRGVGVERLRELAPLLADAAWDALAPPKRERRGASKPRTRARSPRVP